MAWKSLWRVDRSRMAGLVAVLAVLGLTGCAATGAEAPDPGAGSELVVFERDPGFPGPGVDFETVSWVEVDPETGLVWVLQRSQPAVTFWQPDGSYLGGWDLDTLGDPHSLTFQTDGTGTRSVWITDMAPPQPAGPGWGHCLKQYDFAGQWIGSIGTCGENSQGTGLDPVQFDKVTDVALRSDGALYVTDGDLDGLNNRLLLLDGQGDVLEVWSAPNDQPGSGPGEFDLPHANRVDPCGRVWVADTLNHRLQVIGADGDWLGELACFGTDGVYGLALAAPRPGPAGDVAPLFVTASPTTGGSGTAYLFEIPMDCGRPREVGSCTPVTSWSIELPPTSSTSLLHAAATNPAGDTLYIAPLAGDLPPQKWVAGSALEAHRSREDTP